MDQSQSGHPVESFAQKFMINQLANSNSFVNEVLDRLQNSLVKAIPDEKSMIEWIISDFRNPFNACTSLINNSSKFIKLPVSVQMRDDDGQEHKEGIYAVSIAENLGISVLEQCCRKIVPIGEDINLVEARKFEPELGCFCTIPKFSQPIELIESGSKYELVFEKNQQCSTKLVDFIQQQGAKRMSKTFSSTTGFTQVLGSKSTVSFESAYKNEDSMDTSFESTSNYAVDNTFLSKLFSRESNADLPESNLSAESSITWTNRDAESVRLLPEFNPIAIFTSSSRGCSILEHLKKHKMERNGKIRINFVQILGQYFLNEIRTKLEIPPSAALRRAFIDKVFTGLEEIVKPLPPQENFSNRMGKGYFDVYLKHQNTKSRRVSNQPLAQVTTGIEEFAHNLVEHLEKPRRSRTNSTASSNSPICLSNDQSSIKSENFEHFAYQ